MTEDQTVPDRGDFLDDDGGQIDVNNVTAEGADHVRTRGRGARVQDETHAAGSESHDDAGGRCDAQVRGGDGVYGGEVYAAGNRSVRLLYQQLSMRPTTRSPKVQYQYNPEVANVQGCQIHKNERRLSRGTGP